MKQILFYFTILLTIFTGAPLQAATANTDTSLPVFALTNELRNNKLRRTSDSLNEIVRRRQSQSNINDPLIEHMNPEDLMNSASGITPDPFERSNHSVLNTSGNSDLTLTDSSPQSRLRRARKSITFVENRPTLQQNNPAELLVALRNNNQALSIETPSSAEVGITQPPEPTGLKRWCIEGAGVSTLCGLLIYLNHLKQQESRSSQKRFITGFEPMVAGAVLKGTLAYGSSLISLSLVGYSLWKIKRWVHSSCRSDQKLLEEKFETLLTQHVQEVNVGFEQVNHDIVTLAGDVSTIAEVLEEVLPPEQAQEMQSITNNTTAIQNNNGIRLKTPTGKKCCGSSCNMF